MTRTYKTASIPLLWALCVSVAVVALVAPHLAYAQEEDAYGQRVEDREFTISYSNVEGIAVDDDYAYITRYTTNNNVASGSHIHVYQLSDGALQSTREVTTHGSNDIGLGIAVSDDYVYHLDSHDRRIYVYGRLSGLRQTALEITLDTANSSSHGMDIDSTYAYVVDSTDRQVYVYRLSDGSRQQTLEFSLAALNTAARGIAVSGGTAYVLDRTDRHVYVYRLSDGARLIDRELSVSDLPANSASGLAFGGGHLYVVGSAARRVYVYRLRAAPAAPLLDPGDRRIGVTWTPPDNGGVAISDYDVEYRTGSSGDFATHPHTGASTTATITGLTNRTEYQVRVRATNDVGTGDWSPTASARPQATPTTATFGLSADNQDFAAAVETSVVIHDGYRCLQSLSGVSVTINNAPLTVHGFCARADDATGMEVELHLSASSTYGDLKRFADVTGNWWFLESGVAAQDDLRIYDDNFTTEEDSAATIADDTLSFTESIGGLEASTRLGFTTMAKKVSDDDCAEGDDADHTDTAVVDGAGFGCSRANLSSLSAGDDAVLLFTLTEGNKVEFADTPTIPESLTVTRNDEYTTATLTWELYDAVTTYEVQRLQAVQVDVSDASRIEYGDPVTFNIQGTQEGIDEYEDATVEAHRTYQFRVRARGAGVTAWSPWTEYVFSGAKPEVDLPAPGNLELVRDSTSVMALWSSPPGDLDNYTLQRQELVVAEGSTFFANVLTLADEDSAWIAANTTTFTDNGILPNQIYEYRVAAVLDDQVGAYSDWFRVGPPITSLGAAPDNLKFLEDGNRMFDERREFWMGWDEVGGADDYEVQLLAYDVRTGGQAMETRVVSDPTYFVTAYGRVGLRVRGRKLDADTCSAAADNRCLSEWTGWYEVRFTPKVTVEAPVIVDDTADASVMEFREDMKEIVRAVMEPAGATIDPEQVFEFATLLAALVFAALSIALSWRRGMAPLGVGMGTAIFILVLFAGYRMLGTPLAWPVAAEVLVAVAGVYALVRQTGVFR